MCVVEGEGVCVWVGGKGVCVWWKVKVCVCVRLKGEGIVATGGVPSGYTTAHTS